jgi:hypothetical protein
MRATLKYYTDQQQYEKDFPYKIETKKSISIALEEAKQKIREVRHTPKFIGFKVFDKYGDLKYKLPSY